MVWAKFDESVVFEQLSVRRVDGYSRLEFVLKKVGRPRQNFSKKIEKFSEKIEIFYGIFS